ncbi:MAG: cell division protein ZapA, partial [Selenomonadales bacterium]|nr:cell division protein ZapA [Selenomonadales bacterium]
MAVKYNAEIFGDTYPLKSDDHDVNYLQQLAYLVDSKMRRVSGSGISVDIKRICILASLQVAEEYMDIREAATKEINRLNGELEKQSAKIKEEAKAEMARITNASTAEINRVKAEAKEEAKA